MAEAAPGPDARTLAAQMDGIAFRAGVEEGRWSVLLLDFPVLVVCVVGCDLSHTLTAALEFRLFCDGFPARPPFVERWDAAAGRRPPSPTGAMAPPGLVDAFKEWHRDGSTAEYGGVYRAWQRHAAVHNGWAAKRPDEAWRRDRDFSFIMERLYDLASDQADWLAARAAA